VYAGIVEANVLEALREKAGPHGAALAQGACFAAKARQRAGNVSDYTELAVAIICGLSVSEAAQLADSTLENLPANEALPPYEIWRQRIQRQFGKSVISKQ
jgi:hypothetical protein